MKPEELGEIRREFKPGLENLIAGVIIGLLLIVGGCAAVYFPLKTALSSPEGLPFWANEGWCWGAVAFLAAVGLAFAACGFLLIVAMRSMSSLRVRVAQNGFSVTEKNKTQVYAWDDIRCVRETHLYERPPILKGLAKYALPKMKSTSFDVKRKDSEVFGFDGTSIRGHMKLARMIKEETDRRGVPWEIVERHA